ncbi:MAG: arginase family protein [Roseiflexaceae bacterium]|nr:arginase family protein [Roseiflexaceae bacterium]
MPLSIIGVPFDLDQLQVAKGRAPEALLAAGLLQRLRTAGADLSFELLDGALPAGEPVARIGAMLGRLREAVAAARAAGRLPLVIGGDCLTALGTLAGLGQPEQTAVAWVDAHGDFNTPDSTLSGYLGGMPLACAVGRGLTQLREQVQLAPVQERNVVLLGVRDLDGPEQALLAASEATVLNAIELVQHQAKIDGALKLLRAAGQLYLHLDIDVLDNTTAPGVDYPAAGGISSKVLHELVASIAASPNLAAVALTAVNPERDIAGRTVQAALDALDVIVAARNTQQTLRR